MVGYSHLMTDNRFEKSLMRSDVADLIDQTRKVLRWNFYIALNEEFRDLAEAGARGTAIDIIAKLLDIPQEFLAKEPLQVRFVWIGHDGVSKRGGHACWCVEYPRRVSGDQIVQYGFYEADAYYSKTRKLQCINIANNEPSMSRTLGKNHLNKPDNYMASWILSGDERMGKRQRLEIKSLEEVFQNYK